MAYLIRCPLCCYPKRVDNRTALRCRNTMCDASILSYAHGAEVVALFRDNGVTPAIGVDLGTSERSIMSAWMVDRQQFRHIRTVEL